MTAREEVGAKKMIEKGEQFDEAMPPKKKTTAPEAEPAPDPINEPEPEQAPTPTQATTDGEVPADDDKKEAKSPIAGWGAKKVSKVKKTKESEGNLYVVFKPKPNENDEIWEENKEGSVKAVYMLTPGEDEIPYVVYEAELDKPHVVRVFRSWTAVKGYYIKSYFPFYVKQGEIKRNRSA
eukprot:g17865.t1